MLTANLRAPSMRGHVLDEYATQNSTSGGSSDNDVNGLAADVLRVLDRAVTPVPLVLVLLVRVLRVVDEQIDTVAELEYGLGHVEIGIVGGARPVVGEVRDRDALDLDAEPERRIGVPD